MFPAIEPSEVGVTGLAWLFLSYGYVLYYASGLISEGSDLLLLVPSMAGLVGGVVLPLLGAVPDGAIMLFSGLGDLETAQESLSVGVGALAGSTIMLLTVPWGLSIIAGRVSLDSGTGIPNYMGKPKVQDGATMSNTGVSIASEVTHGGVIMMMTTVPYFLIQGPAMFLHGPSSEVAAGEKYWALSGLVVCLIGFFSYLYLQLKISQEGTDRMRRVAVMKKLLQKGAVSLSGALTDAVKDQEARLQHKTTHTSDGEVEVEYGSVPQQPKVDHTLYPAEPVCTYLKEILKEAFMKYDQDHNGQLERKEIRVFFKDFHEDVSDDEMDTMFDLYDKNKDNTISFDEFIGACYTLIKKKDDATATPPHEADAAQTEIVSNVFADDEEEEEVPEDIASLSPEAQQTAIKQRAFAMLSLGTFLVLLFADPMVDVMQEIAVRMGLSPFYVAFVLAPLASNASEVLASQYYAAKKTRKTIAVSLTALEGAASMNNTFGLSIFMGLIFFRGLAWQYTAETVSIIVVQFVIGTWVARRSVFTSKEGIFILAIFPLSILLVAGLEALGFD